MRSILLKRIASVLALLGAVAFVAATSAVAEGPTFSGNAGAAFGQVSYGESATADSYSELVTSIESNLRFTVGDDTLKALGRYRIRGHESTATGGGSTALGSGDQPRNVYGEVHWKPMPALEILFGTTQGPAWSQPMTGTYIILNPLGHQEYWMNWTGISGLDVTYNAGAVQVGVGIASQCRPSCGGGTAGATVNQAAQSIVPHATGNFGAISFRLQLPQTSGKVVGATTETAKGSGFQLGVKFASGGFTVAADAQSFTDKALTSTDKDVKKTGTNLKVTAAGAQLLYSQIKPNADADLKNTEIKLAYGIKVGGGTLMPVIVRQTTGGAGKTATDDKTDMTVRLVGTVGF